MAAPLYTAPSPPSVPSFMVIAQRVDGRARVDVDAAWMGWSGASERGREETSDVPRESRRGRA
jgi:hypothetical protein